MFWTEFGRKWGLQTHIHKRGPQIHPKWPKIRDYAGFPYNWRFLSPAWFPYKKDNEIFWPKNAIFLEIMRFFATKFQRQSGAPNFLKIALFSSCPISPEQNCHPPIFYLHYLFHALLCPLFDPFLGLWPLLAPFWSLQEQHRKIHSIPTQYPY